MKDLILYENSKDYQISYTDIKKVQKKDSLVVVQGGENNRTIVENKHVDILVDAENISQGDHLHFRKSGLDQVICPLMKKNNIALAFSFSSVLNSKRRSQLLGRMIQNVKLCRKYKVKMILASFAKDKWEQRAEPELHAFGKVIGMTDVEVKEATSFVPKILEKKKKTIAKGITHL